LVCSCAAPRHSKRSKYVNEKSILYHIILTSFQPLFYCQIIENSLLRKTSACTNIELPKTVPLSLYFVRWKIQSMDMPLRFHLTSYLLLYFLFVLCSSSLWASVLRHTFSAMSRCWAVHEKQLGMLDVSSCIRIRYATFHFSTLISFKRSCYSHCQVRG
jgi:hypothetical protein